MLKRPFLLFVLIMSLLTGSSIWFIQSPYFANTLKKVISKYIPSDVGVFGDFTELSVTLFPPGVSIKSPALQVKDGNHFGLKSGTTLVAERMDVQFLPVQMFYGDIRVHRLRIVNGNIHLLGGSDVYSNKKKKNQPGFDFQWNSFLKIRIDSIELDNTQIKVEFIDPSFSIAFMAVNLEITKALGEDKTGYNGSLNLKDLRGVFPKSWGVPSSLQEMQGKGRISSKGIEILSVNLKQQSSEIFASGKIIGDVLSGKELPGELQVEASGDIEKTFKEWMLIPKKKNFPEGEFRFSGKLNANFNQLYQTSKIAGELVLLKFKYNDWLADQVRIDGGWSTGAHGGELSVNKAVVFSKEEPRIGGVQLGRGGKIEAGSFKWRLGSAEPVSIPLNLENAHIHWLAANAVEDIYPLDFRASGTVNVKIHPAKSKNSWNLIANTALKIKALQLDNQRLNQKKTLRKVVFIPLISLDGNVSVDASGIHPAGLALTLPNSKFQISGRVDFQSGFDLHVAGETNLSDIGQLAEVNIKGEGALRAHVHGPSSNVMIDFDADLKNTEYLSLHLGNLLGRITWDDDLEKLLISNVGLTKGQTIYTADGKIELSQKGEIFLGFKISSGDISDFISVFEELTKDLWWFPRGIRGSMDGQVQVAGGLDLKELDINAQMGGMQWEYLGEKFKTVYLRGGFDRGKYYIESFRAQKRNGRFAGRISFDSDKKIDWEIHSEDLLVGEIDHIARLDVPIRGRLGIKSSGRGKAGSIESRTHLSLTEAVVRGVGMAPSDLAIESEGGVLRFKGIIFDGQGSAELVYNSKPGSSSYFKSHLSRLDFSPLLLLLNTKAIQDRSLLGLISGEVDINFREGEIERASGKMELSEYLLQKSGANFKLVKPISVKIDKGSFEIPGLSLKGDLGVATLSLKSENTILEGSVTGELDLSIAEFLTSTVSQALGTARLDFAIGGTTLSPVVYGRSFLSGKSLRIHALETPFENISGFLQLKQNILSVQNIEADLANGRVTAQGTIHLFISRYPKISLVSTLSGNKLKLFPFQFVKVRGNLNVHGEEIPYLVDGTIFVDSALSKEKIMSQGNVRSLKSARFLPPPSTEQEGAYPKFKLNINAIAERGVLVQNELFDAEMKGNVTVVNTIETPRIVGSAEIIQGKMLFKDRAFQIQTANLIFDNPTVINPKFNLMANAEINNTKIQLYTSGKMSSFKVELSSNPVMTEQEILTLLALGLSAEDVKRLGALERGTVEMSKATDILLHSMDFNRDVQNKTGFQIQLDESVSTPSGSSVFRPRQETTESSVAPKVILKRKIGKKLELSFGSTVGVGTSTEQEVNAEVNLTPGFSVIGVWDSIGDATTQNRTSYGVDLKLQKRFR